jgi:hypothetical protein
LFLGCSILVVQAIAGPERWRAVRTKQCTKAISASAIRYEPPDRGA